MSINSTRPLRVRADRIRRSRVAPATTSAPSITRTAHTVVAGDVGDGYAEALEAARQERQTAERDLRRSEIARDRAAHALELAVPPARIDEAGRAHLRAVHAQAASNVDEKRAAVQRADEVVRAAALLADAIGDDSGAGRALADGLARLVAERRYAGKL